MRKSSIFQTVICGTSLIVEQNLIVASWYDTVWKFTMLCNFTWTFRKPLAANPAISIQRFALHFCINFVLPNTTTNIKSMPLHANLILSRWSKMSFAVLSQRKTPLGLSFSSISRNQAHYSSFCAGNLYESSNSPGISGRSLKAHPEESPFRAV